MLPALALALLFAARADAAAVPLIVDTDMFSDADDVGALATAFGLQYRGEAEVIAVAVNTRTSRRAVATSSWRCVAAIDAFYGSAAVPIGTAMPNTGSSAGDAGFATPCARSAPSLTPGTALDVYRRGLAGAADGSVVIASTGFLGNLSALLGSPADAISPLSGRELIARKVKVLVAMAGGYPSRNGETNLNGDPAAAQNVAANWPTKIVWSGWEVGAGVHTGQTISDIHPGGSPVRAAYEAFAGAGAAITSWDLTAVYHAVRPGDPLLREVGPGTNVVRSTGANSFTTGSGNQYYLALGRASALEHAIDDLLGTLRPVAPPAEPAAAPPAPAASAAPPPAVAPVAAPPPDAAPVAVVASATAPRAPGCVVPTLRGRTFEGARRLLHRHRCTLGRVSRPHGKRRVRVARQSLAPLTARRRGTRVDLILRQVS